MIRYKVTIEYDGTQFAGWQKQNNHESIQETIETAIYKFSRQKVETFAAGRTDAGVHALGQVIHFDLEKEYSEHTVLTALNHYLREFSFEKRDYWEKVTQLLGTDELQSYLKDKTDHNFLQKLSRYTAKNIQPPSSNQNIAVTNCEIVDENFNARFGAKKRYYCYRILPRSSPSAIRQNRVWHLWNDLDIDKMQEAAKSLIGNHDFTSFRSTECQAKSPVKTLDNINIYRQDDEIILEFTAKSFLHNMVRNIVGTLKLVGENKISSSDIKKILESKDRTQAGPTAPACGLYFVKAEY